MSHRDIGEKCESGLVAAFLVGKDIVDLFLQKLDVTSRCKSGNSESAGVLADDFKNITAY